MALNQFSLLTPQKDGYVILNYMCKLTDNNHL